MYTAADHTFVVCAYKENPYLESTILTLKDQTAPSTVMVSTSTPSAYLYGICEKHQTPLVVNERHGLAGDDWNYAYNAASTSLVTLAHQDDFYEPAYAETVVRYANKVAGASILFTDYFEIRDGKNVVSNVLLTTKRVMNAPFRVSGLNGRRGVKRRVLAFGCSICCPSVTFAKDILGESIFDTTYKNSCDYKTWVDLASRDGRFIYIPRRLVGHRIYSESATSKNLGEDIRKGEDHEILSSLWPRPIATAINALYALSEKSNELR